MREGWLWGLSVVVMLVVAIPVYLLLLLVTSTLYAAAVAYAVGFSAGSVIQGTNGSNSGLLYHLVSSRRRRLGDFVIVATISVVFSLSASFAVDSVLDGFAAELAVLFVAVVVSEITFGLRRPNYEEQLRSLADDRQW